MSISGLSIGPSRLAVILLCLSARGIWANSTPHVANVVSAFVYPENANYSSTIVMADQALYFQTIYYYPLDPYTDVKYKSKECYKCSFTNLDVTVPGYYVNSRYPYDFVFTLTNPVSLENSTCNITDFQFTAGAVYWGIINYNSSGAFCEPLIKGSGPKTGSIYGVIYGLLYAAFLLGLFLSFRHYHRTGALYAYFPSAQTRTVAADLGHADLDYSFVSSLSSESLQRNVGAYDTNGGNTSIVQFNSTSAAVSNRLKSIDTFRGLSIVLMIFVNYGGGGYWYFNHSPWNGLTIADMVFPWFVFIMGVSIATTMKGMSGNEVRMKTGSQLGRILKRSLTLFLFGMAISNPNALAEKLRIMGVLQRLAVSFLFVASLTLLTARFLQKANISELCRRSQNLDSQSMRRHFFDLDPFYPEWIVMAVVVLIWTLVTFLVHDQDCPKGYLGPGGMQQSDNYNLTKCTGGAAGYIDRSLFGADHTYQHPTAMQVYGLSVLPFDPEGLLGCLTSILLTFFGTHAGRIIHIYGEWRQVVPRLLVWALITGLLGGSLCGFSKYDGLIPINKNLWSLSFVLINACSGFVLLALFYLVNDVSKVWDGAPFTYAGMNSLLLYIGHEMLYQHFPFSWGVKYPSHVLYMFENVTACVIWISIAGYCYSIQFFFKV